MIFSIDDQARQSLMSIAPQGKAILDRAEMALEARGRVYLRVEARQHQAQHIGPFLINCDPTCHLGESRRGLVLTRQWTE
jgi:hypothetical protein